MNNFNLKRKSANLWQTSWFYDAIEARDFIDTYKIKSDKIKYYKGLGTSSDKDISSTFGKNLIRYDYDDKAQLSLDKMFNKKCADLRKSW